MKTLRKSVVVKLGDEQTTISHGFWSLGLPSTWVRTTAGMNRLLCNAGSTLDVEQDDIESAGVLELLSKTHCLTFPVAETYSLREVLSIFRAVCSTWHGSYYSHPLWAKLRTGELSRNAVIAWALHNYHLSRSAGVTAARCVVANHSKAIRSVFLESAIEEYPHCELYYSLDDNRLGVSRKESIECLPSKATLIFEQQLLRIAEIDWLGHLFVGYFQESTAVFYEECCEFYKSVEERYDLLGFFSGWKSHIRLDHEYGHADAFSDAFNSDQRVTHSRVINSLTNALWIAQALIIALDEILLVDRNDDRVCLRLPAFLATPELLNGQDAGTGQSCTSLRLLLSAISKEHGSCLIQSRSLPVSESEREFLRQQVVVSLTRGLGFARRHDEIVAIGHMLELCQSSYPLDFDVVDNCAPSLRAAGIANLLRETASNTRDFVVVLWISKEVLGSTMVLDFESARENTIGMWLDQLVNQYELAPSEVKQCFGLAYQTIEMLQPVFVPSYSRLDLDIFTDCS